jgi:DNA repair protein RadC
MKTSNPRPRERLLSQGAQVVSTTELLSILIATGTHAHSVESIAKQVEALVRLHRVNEMTKEMLLGITGIGEAKACTLLAALELGERLQAEEAQSFTSPDVVANYLQDLQSSQKETLVGLYLNARYLLVHKEVLSIGSLNQTILEPRDIFSAIKQFPVAYLILAHNHPSGDPKPSEEDKEFTLRMQEAGELLGIELVDHIIIAKHKRFSFKEEKYL